MMLKNLGIMERVANDGLTAVVDQKSLLKTLSTNLVQIGSNLLTSQNPQPDEEDEQSDFEEFGEDGFQALPREVILHILSFLDLISLCRCAQVCRLFYESSQDPRLYNRLCLKSLFHLVNSQCLFSLAKRAKFLAYLDMSWVGNYGQICSLSLNTLLKACANSLVYLRLNNCHAVDTSVMETLSMYL